MQKANPTIINNNLAHNIHHSNNNQTYNVNTENILNHPNLNISEHHNTGNNITYEIPKYNSKTNVEKIETYYIDPKTGKEIKLDSDNTIEKYKNKTYIVDNNIPEKLHKEIYAKVEKVEDYKKIPSNELETLTPILENLNINATTAVIDPQINTQINIEKKKITASCLSVSTLSDLPYQKYPQAKHSNESSENFSGFGVNSYNGKVKNYNEDRIKVVTQEVMQSKKDPNKTFNISYFSIFDGHSGKKCSDFLKKRFFEFLIKSTFFPDEPLRAIREAFQKAEAHFFKKAYDPVNKVLLDKSGSCALIMLIINDILYSINLGDSRALYSYDSGKCLLQITRDHKPNDDIEKKRIEKVGGKVYYANTITRNGIEIELKEEDFGEGFTFPYRISPGKIAVNNIFYIIYKI